MYKDLNKFNFSNVSTLKKTVVISGFFLSLFSGLLSAIVGVDNFKNYDKPYFFGITFGFLGVIVAFYTGKKIKPYVVINPIMHSNYSDLVYLFALGFIGHFMLLGFYLNNSLSELNKCNEYTVVEKIHIKSRHRRPERNILILNVDGKHKNLLCKINYWKSISIGQKIIGCDYKSKICFDSFVLPNDY